MAHHVHMAASRTQLAVNEHWAETWGLTTVRVTTTRLAPVPTAVHWRPLNGVKPTSAAYHKELEGSASKDPAMSRARSSHLGASSRHTKYR